MENDLRDSNYTPWYGKCLERILLIVSSTDKKKGLNGNIS